VVICGKFEAELADLESEEERLAFLGEIGLSESGLASLIHAAYRLLAYAPSSPPARTSAAPGPSTQAIPRRRRPA
jgi:hypothetical protein